jgi:predicted DNA binding protein
LLVAGLLALPTLGVLALFPLLKDEGDAYWALLLFSVLIAVWAWPLRITSKLYLMHRNLYEDASEREVIASTFLALGENQSLTEQERQLLLAALMRQASANASGDDGGLNVADLVFAKFLTK